MAQRGCKECGKQWSFLKVKKADGGDAADRRGWDEEAVGTGRAGLWGPDGQSTLVCPVQAPHSEMRSHWPSCSFRRTTGWRS